MLGDEATMAADESPQCFSIDRPPIIDDWQQMNMRLRDKLIANLEGPIKLAADRFSRQFSLHPSVSFNTLWHKQVVADIS